jgi:hypothetical protein
MSNGSSDAAAVPAQEPSRRSVSEGTLRIIREIAIALVVSFFGAIGFYWLSVHGQMASFEERLENQNNDIVELKGEGLTAQVSALNERVRTLETLGTDTSNTMNLINLIHGDVTSLEEKVEAIQKELSASAALTNDHRQEIESLRCGCNQLVEKITAMREKVAILDAVQNERQSLLTAEN